MTHANPRFVLATDAARALGISYHLARQLPVRWLRVGGRYLAYLEDIEALVGGRLNFSGDTRSRAPDKAA